MSAERYTYKKYGTAWLKFKHEGRWYDATWDNKGAVTVVDTEDNLRIPDNHPAVGVVQAQKRQIDLALERSMRVM